MAEYCCLYQSEEFKRIDLNRMQNELLAIKIFQMSVKNIIKTTHQKYFFSDFYILLRLSVVCRKGI